MPGARAFNVHPVTITDHPEVLYAPIRSNSPALLAATRIEVWLDTRWQHVRLLPAEDLASSALRLEVVRPAGAAAVPPPK